MISLRLSTEYHRKIYFFGLILMAVGLPFSKILMSVSQFVLLGNWLWEGGLKDKLKLFWNNKAAVILSSLPLLYIIGLIYSSDINYALNDIRIKLPLLVLPLVIASTTPLNKKEFHWLMNIFSLAVVSATIISAAIYSGITNKVVDDVRGISIFMSHIRFSLLICIAILFLFYSVINIPATNFLRWIKCFAALWLIAFLFILESMTGLVVLTAALFVFFLIFSLKQPVVILKIFYTGILLLFLMVPVFFLYLEIKNYYSVNPVDFSRLEEFSKNGERYVHDKESRETENGNYVWIYIAPNELEQTWNSRSAIKFTQKDMKGQLLKNTLVRFLTSKGLRKDAEGVQLLSDKEVKAVEGGVADAMYQHAGIRTRIYQITWEFDNYFRGGNPQGNSVTQRLEFWKAAWNGIKQNPVWGVGTGDLQTEMNKQYDEIKTYLEPQYRLKPHNQFITITVAFGAFGLLWFLKFLFLPVIFSRQKCREGEYFYTTFLVIALLSMFTEDTLDTQAGISFFTFFSCLFLFGRNAED